MRYGAATALSLLVLATALVNISASAADTRSDDDGMQGEWTIESLTFHGNPIEATELSTWRRIVEKNHITWKRDEETLIELDIKYDAALKPKTLDSTVASGNDKGQTALAIYELNGDTLRVCFADPGQARPTEFSSNSGSLQSVYTARRIKKP